MRRIDTLLPLMRFGWLLLLITALAACLSDRPFSDDPVVNARPYVSDVPRNYNGQPTPLILALHGFPGSGLGFGRSSGLEARVHNRGFLLAAPDGADLVGGELGWSVSCCDEGLNAADDVAYLRAVIADMSQKYNVDPARVYIVGYSNGGFMAYRMACDASDLLAGIAVLAGTMIEDEVDSCYPESPVALLHAHGTKDVDVLPGGGSLDYGRGPIPYLSARDTLDFWRAVNACGDSTDTASLDGDNAVPGAETSVTRYSNCSEGSDIELWDMVGSGHAVDYTDDYVEALLDFLLERSKK